MKAEHRKELLTNTLAHRLGDAVQSIKEGPSRRTVAWLSVIGVLVVAFLAWRYFANRAEENDSARWRDWNNLTTPAQLKAFIDSKEIQEHLQGRLARIQEARRALHDGLRKLGHAPARKEALEDLNKAAELYDQLVKECADKPLLHQQVLNGAAKAQESLGNIEPARGYYQQLRDKYGDSVFGADAADQLQRLDAAANSDELKWLHAELTPPAASANPLPLGGTGPAEGAKP